MFTRSDSIRNESARQRETLTLSYPYPSPSLARTTENENETQKNIDRRPPTLVQSYTALKLRHPDRALSRSLARASLAELVPLLQESEAPERPRRGQEAGQIEPSACISLVGPDGARASVYVSLERLFDGDHAGFWTPAGQAQLIGDADDDAAMPSGAIQSAHTTSDAARLVARSAGGLQEWQVDRGRLRPSLKCWTAQLPASAQHVLLDSALAYIDGGRLVGVSEAPCSNDTFNLDAQALSIERLDEQTVALVCDDGTTQALRWAGSKWSTLFETSLSSSGGAITTAKIVQHGGGLICVFIELQQVCIYESPSSGDVQWRLRARWPITIPGSPATPPIDIARDGKVALCADQRVLILDSRAKDFSSGVEQGPLYTTPVRALSWDLSSSKLTVAAGDEVSILIRAHADEDGHRWEPIARVSCQHWARQVDSVVFTAQDEVAVVASGMMRVYRPILSAGPGSAAAQQYSLAEAIARVNGPKAQYHPGFLRACLLQGSISAAIQILSSLSRVLASASPDDSDPLPFNELDASAFWLQVDTLSKHADLADTSETPEDLALPREEAMRIIKERASAKTLPSLSGADLLRLVQVAETVWESHALKGTLDRMGIRYLVGLRELADGTATASPLGTASQHRSMAFALHSSTQEQLLHLVETTYQGKLTWASARKTGAFLWLQSHQTLTELAERVARNQYTAGEERDPVGASRFYFALGKAKLVTNLWRQAVGHPEQRKMIHFLANDFTTERWKAAAQKNAFALLSQRRFEFAVSFFLLAGALKDAVSICVKHLDDVQLAVALCRIQEGRDDGPVLRELLQERVLPRAFEQGDRWLATWAFWTLGRRDLALRVLITSMADLLREEGVSELVRGASDSADISAEDPSLALLYADLKDKVPRAASGAGAVSPEKETRFVLHMNQVLIGQGESRQCHWRWKMPRLTRCVLRPRLSHPRARTTARLEVRPSGSSRAGRTARLCRGPRAGARERGGHCAGAVRRWAGSSHAVGAALHSPPIERADRQHQRSGGRSGRRSHDQHRAGRVAAPRASAAAATEEDGSQQPDEADGHRQPAAGERGVRLFELWLLRLYCRLPSFARIHPCSSVRCTYVLALHVHGC